MEQKITGGEALLLLLDKIDLKRFCDLKIKTYKLRNFY